MALILAIESDKKQAARLATIARDPLHAELVIGESTEQAFTLLAGRHPDLILTSLLLSPKDEAALAVRLHEFDVAGWRVQTLVIPVLGGHKGGRSSESGGGLLTRLRGKASREESSSRGCDPGVFATQVAEYLERAAAERAVALEDAEALAAAASARAAAEAIASETSPTPVDEEAAFAASFDASEPSPAVDDVQGFVTAPESDVQAFVTAPEDDVQQVATTPDVDAPAPPVEGLEVERVEVEAHIPVVLEASAAHIEVPRAADIEPQSVVISARPAASSHVVPFDILDDLDAVPDPVLVVDDAFEHDSPIVHAQAAEDVEDEAVEIPLDEIAETPVSAPEPAPTAILLDEPEIELPEIEIITTSPFDSHSAVAEEPHVELLAAPLPVETPIPQQDGWSEPAHDASAPGSIDGTEKQDEEADSQFLIQAEPIDLAFMEICGPVAPPPVRVQRAADAAPVVFPDPAPAVLAAPGDRGSLRQPEAERESASAEGRDRGVTGRAGVGPREKGKEDSLKPVVAAPPKSQKKGNKRAAAAAPAMPPLVPAPKRPALVAQPPDALRLVWAWPRLEGAASEDDFSSFVTDQPPDDRVAQLAPPAEARGGRSKNKRGQEPQQSRKKQKAPPPQDEWGFFDPEQCGFAALVAKLDELALDELGKEEPTPSRRK